MHLRDTGAEGDGDATVTAAEQVRRDRVSEWAGRLRGARQHTFDSVAAATSSTDAPTPAADATPGFDEGLLFRPRHADPTDADPTDAAEAERGDPGATADP